MLLAVRDDDEVSCHFKPGYMDRAFPSTVPVTDVLTYQAPYAAFDTQHSAACALASIRDAPSEIKEYEMERPFELNHWRSDEE